MASSKQIKVWVNSKKKPVAKGATIAKTKEKFVAVKKKACSKQAPKNKAFTGFARINSGILVPDDYAKIVPASKLHEGFIKAKEEINHIVDDILETMTEDYGITEIELNASFSADGKFMGFGVGGAASIKIKIAPQRHRKKVG